ncbi:MAG: DEAD/DEAH box helicase family protein [Nitrososphaerales archaeon]
MNNLVCVGVQPYTIKNSELYLILGKERYSPGWRDSNTWCSFAGRPDRPLTLRDIDLAREEALRELDEESMGIFGTPEELRPLLNHYYAEGRSVIFFLPVTIDSFEEFKRTFANIHRHFIRHGPCAEGELEKSEITFVTVPELKRMGDLRRSYRGDLPGMLKALLLSL